MVSGFEKLKMVRAATAMQAEKNSFIKTVLKQEDAESGGFSQGGGWILGFV